jgi:hypothetical protein
MPRRIITEVLHAGGAAARPDAYFDRLLKYIPGEVVAAWVAVSNVIKSGSKGDPKADLILWIAFVVGLFVTGIWVWQQTKVPALPTARLQIVVSLAAFVVWVFALGGPFATLAFYREYYGSLLLIAFTLISGAINPR